MRYTKTFRLARKFAHNIEEEELSEGGFDSEVHQQMEQYIDQNYEDEPLGKDFDEPMNASMRKFFGSDWTREQAAPHAKALMERELQKGDEANSDIIHDAFPYLSEELRSTYSAKMSTHILQMLFTGETYMLKRSPVVLHSMIDALMSRIGRGKGLLLPPRHHYNSDKEITKLVLNRLRQHGVSEPILDEYIGDFEEWAEKMKSMVGKKV